MKTDALFYELFRLEPQSLFDLVSLNMEGEYIFESITVKTTEKRFDGFLKRVDNQGPKEIKKMIQLTPLDKTVAGQELISIGIKIGKKEAKEEAKEANKKEGIKLGELIGEIRTLQRISKLPQSIKTELAKKTIKELKAMLKQLKSEL